MTRMRLRHALAPVAVAALATVGARPLSAQDAAASAPTPLAVGATAPDFTLRSATARGVDGSVTLSKLRGKTVVLAFFFKARTKG